MSFPESYIKPVIQLLTQTSSPFDVPADPRIFSHSWLEPVSAHALSLLDAVGDGETAPFSSTGGGLTHLLLASNSADNFTVHLRVAGEGDVTVREAQEKSVVLTLSGSMELEAFRHGGDVDDDTPWYVRQFVPENVYACHPGTLHSIQQSDDAIQLVISRGMHSEPGRALTADECRAVLDRARQTLRQSIEARGDAAGEKIGPGQEP
jgi:hypothetical protein